VAVGVAFIILMPIIGLILCLCRCAGHCGGKRRHDDVAKDNRCRRATCGLLLLILATLITYVCYLFIYYTAVLSKLICDGKLFKSSLRHDEISALT